MTPLFKKSLLAFTALNTFLVLTGQASADARVVTTFRVLHQNIYGRDKRECTERYKALARHILAANPPYDIVTLNEHWNTSLGDLVGETCDSSVLSDALLEDGRYQDGPDADRHRQSYPNGNLYQMGGGNSVFTTHRITHYDSWKFSNTNNIPVSGFLLSRIELAPGVSIDLWSTQLEADSDGCHEACHQTQIRDIADQIRDEHSPNPVLMAGDFNVGAPMSIVERGLHYGNPAAHPYTGNVGYDFLMSTMRYPSDLWLQAHPLQPDSNDGYTYDDATNPIADPDGRERIDLLLAPANPAFVSGSSRIRVKEMSVVRWKTVGGMNISDHYGLDATLEIVR
jgi:endonuclease/exonuclease/phosphatase family metal-dependent hydrolase